MITIGLTGGIASGKSSVADAFKVLGVPVLSADQEAREVVRSGSMAANKIIKHMGQSIQLADGSIDRAKLRERIFADPAERKWLEGLLHPLILSRLENKLSVLECPYSVVEIPLLVEAGLTSQFEKVIVVDADPETQIQRLIARDKLTRQQAIAHLASQASREERLAIADHVIDNSGSLEALNDQVADLHQAFSQLTT